MTLIERLEAAVLAEQEICVLLDGTSWDSEDFEFLQGDLERISADIEEMHKELSQVMGKEFANQYLESLNA